ncbi:putative methyltransferase [Methanoregula boonei 6A8]|jgi:methyltransferase (TIGR00027 family)|uniref:Putative methyltransferase n=1 Tax=Methanoregula boonei (strain DSM 21154 / JCM 14090 / 6A8) TaxID=456442 RepID=A7I8K1_METB6|nr:SAM-dependent methyltransferase [Methanoregula boonei]ABS56062.1 putative methyltransferase [Methanoregula boonei 6A8]
MEQAERARDLPGNHTRSGPSLTAERVAAFRAAESALQEDQRVCYDPYAIRFTDPDHLDELTEYTDNHFPGLRNYIAARARHFDDVITLAAKTGLEQLVILGAGYDTRAYRIAEFKGRVRVFELDHPDTQEVKKEKIEELFRGLPKDVVYVPVDLETQDWGRRLLEAGYSPEKKTLFVMEGLIMYLTPTAIDAILSFVVNNSGKNSAVLFDYPAETGDTDASSREMREDLGNHTARHGEPILFSMPKEGPGAFLRARGFSRLRITTGEEYRGLYFNRKKEGRELLTTSSFMYAVRGDR